VNDGDDDDVVAFVLTGRMILIDGSFGPSRQLLSTVVPNPDRVISRLRWQVCVGWRQFALEGDSDGDKTSKEEKKNKNKSENQNILTVMTGCEMNQSCTVQ
jgi:hypothetical protein